MNQQQAVKQLAATKQLKTTLLKPLNISFESFLKFCQLPDKLQESVVQELINKLT